MYVQPTNHIPNPSPKPLTPKPYVRKLLIYDQIMIVNKICYSNLLVKSGAVCPGNQQAGLTNVSWCDQAGVHRQIQHIRISISNWQAIVLYSLINDDFQYFHLALCNSFILKKIGENLYLEIGSFRGKK